MVEPDLSVFFAPSLTYTRRIVGVGNSVTFKKVRLYDNSMPHEGRPAVCIPAGMTSRVMAILKSEKFDVAFVDRRQLILPEPDLSRVDTPDDAQVDMLAAIITSDHGIIESPTGSGKSWVIRQICKIWPNSNVIIVIPGKVGGELLRQTYQELLRYFHSGEVGMVGMGKRDIRSRITVCMDRSLMHANLKDCRILLFDEVHHAAAPSVATLLSSVTNARRFGFSASPMGRSDQSDLGTVALFGEVIFKASYKQIESSGRVVPIRVLWLNTDKILPRSLSLFSDRDREYPTTMVERHLIWKNQERNRMIAGAVAAIRKDIRDDIQILIIVKTVEHAVHLGYFLPDFTLVYGSMDPKKRARYERDGLICSGKHPITAAERKKYQETFKSGELKRVIATQVWSTGVDFPKLEALIRADAQASPIASTQIPGRVTRCSDGKEVGLVIDCSDGFYRTLEDRARRRRSAYASKGWLIEAWG